jgi:hypothetical protein
MRALGLTVVGVLVLALPSARAQAQQAGFDGERLAPATGAAGYVFVEQPVVPFHLGYGLGLFLHFADDAVVVRNTATGAVVGKPLDGAASFDLLASIGPSWPSRRAGTPRPGGPWARPCRSRSRPATISLCADPTA